LTDGEGAGAEVTIEAETRNGGEMRYEVVAVGGRIDG